jgi:alanine racemase
MALTLTIDQRAWTRHVTEVADRHPRLVPVVKGTGYGFGLTELAQRAVTLLVPDEIAVGTVHEARRLAGIGPTLTVLTPAAAHELPPPPGTVLTVGSAAHVATVAESGWTGAVVVKLASPMHRYGATPDALNALVGAVTDAQLELRGFGLHLPLLGTGGDHPAAVGAWLAALPIADDRRTTVYVSHLDADDESRLRAEYPAIDLRARVGTALWLGDKRFFSLRADVIDVHPVAAGMRAGYRLTPVPGDGHLVMVSCGSAHGVAPLADGRSPFHHARRRVPLLEPPHMHTSVLFVAAGEPLPAVGDEIDVQRPLTQVWIDRIVERG